MARAALPPEAQEELDALLPDLPHGPAPPMARPCPPMRRQRALVLRLRKNAARAPTEAGVWIS
jgi:hypothetical protein